jgi:hypothetical protein
MMRWFYKWLGSKIQDSQYVEEEAVAQQPGINLIGRPKSRKLTSVRESDDLNTEPITFKMFKASGGWAIEFRQYDSRNDRIETSLYVVNDEEELGRHISQIITMEALKR